MDNTTIKVFKETRNKLAQIKFNNGYKTYDDLINDLMKKVKIC